MKIRTSEVNLLHLGLVAVAALAVIWAVLYSNTVVLSAANTFSASPTSGYAPLAVSFVYKGASVGAGTAKSNYTINFGDGTSQMMAIASCAVPPGAVKQTCTLSASHTYKKPSVYPASVYHEAGAVDGSVLITVRTPGTR